MKKKSKRKIQRGAVTVFLALILVPCIIFVCAFGDIARVQLSKARASSAADLTLYSLMSHYDKDLSDYYGLVASCQNINEFYDETTKYFLGMMTASGMSDTGKDLFIQYMDGLRAGDITDFLQVDLASDFGITAAENGSLGENPALIEDSIVEFMKYRGPAEIFTKVVSRFREMDLSSAKEADANKKVSDAKGECAQAQSDLLEAALYSYIAMKQYQILYEVDDVPSIQKYHTVEEELPKIWRDYKGVTELITMYYAGTENIRLVDFPLYSLDMYHYEAKNIGTPVLDDSGTLYCINSDDLEALLKDVDSNIQTIEGAQNRIVQSCQDLPASVAVNEGVNDVRYAMAVQNAVSTSDLNKMRNTGKTLLQIYAQLKAAKDCDPYPTEDNLPYDWEDQIDAAMSKIEEIQNQYFSTAGNTSYMKLVKNYQTCAITRGAVEGVQNCTYEFYSELLGRNATIGQFNEKVKGDLTELQNKLSAQYTQLKIILKGGKITYKDNEYTVKSLEKILDLARTYREKRDDWGSTANNAGTAYGDSEYALYSNKDLSDEEKKTDAMAAAINEEDVKAMMERIEHIMDDIKTLQTALDGFTYGGKSVTKMNGRADIISAGSSVISGQQSLYLQDNKEAASGYFERLIQPSSDQFYQAPSLTTGETGNNPNLKTDCNFFRFLANQFDSKLDDIQKNLEENKNNNKKYQEEAEEERDSAQEADNKFLKGMGDNLPETHGGASGANPITSLVGIADKIINGNIDELRDQIYVCEYIMDMFSYSSFNNEGEYRRLTNGQYTYTDFVSNGYVYPNCWDAWNTVDPANLYENQSLTNRQINQNNNWANLAEVEYILYGAKDNSKNLAKAYKNIYEIRLILNTASGFQNFYSVTNDNHNARAIQYVADAVWGLTAGIVPVPLTKCILIGVMTIVESTHDLNLLKAGMPVALYKSKDDWFCSLDRAGSKISNFKGNEKEGDKNGLYYSDYMYLFLMIGLTSNNTYKAMLLRVGDVIQANMRKTPDNGSFDLSKSLCYFQLSGDLRVKPLFLSLPIVDSMEGVDVTTTREATDWCTYKVEVIRGYS